MSLKSIFCLLTLVTGIAVFADEPGPQYQQPHQSYYGGQNFDPGSQYMCGPQCAPITLPYQGPILQPVPLPPPAPIFVPTPLPYSYVAPTPPIYINPGYPIYPHPYWGGRRFFGRPAWGGRFMPRFRRHISLTDGCTVQQNNNGEFVVLSSAGQVIFRNSSEHAEDYAKFMKAKYENASTGLCKAPSVTPSQSLDI